MATWREQITRALEELIDRGVVTPFWPIIGTGVSSLPLVLLGLWLQIDWLAAAGFALGYASVAWGMCAMALIIGYLWAGGNG